MKGRHARVGFLSLFSIHQVETPLIPTFDVAITEAEWKEKVETEKAEKEAAERAEEEAKAAAAEAAEQERLEQERAAEAAARQAELSKVRLKDLRGFPFYIRLLEWFMKTAPTWTAHMNRTETCHPGGGCRADGGAQAREGARVAVS